MGGSALDDSGTGPGETTSGPETSSASGAGGKGGGEPNGWGGAVGNTNGSMEGSNPNAQPDASRRRMLEKRSLMLTPFQRVINDAEANNGLELSGAE